MDRFVSRWWARRFGVEVIEVGGAKRRWRQGRASGDAAPVGLPELVDGGDGAVVLQAVLPADDAEAEHVVFVVEHLEPLRAGRRRKAGYDGDVPDGPHTAVPAHVAALDEVLVPLRAVEAPHERPHHPRRRLDLLRYERRARLRPCRLERVVPTDHRIQRRPFLRRKRLRHLLTTYISLTRSLSFDRTRPHASKEIPNQTAEAERTKKKMKEGEEKGWAPPAKNESWIKWVPRDVVLKPGRWPSGSQLRRQLRKGQRAYSYILHGHLTRASHDDESAMMSRRESGIKRDKTQHKSLLRPCRLEPVGSAAAGVGNGMFWAYRGTFSSFKVAIPRFKHPGLWVVFETDLF
ncbi:hypothetical protein H6P81_001061 [Aristolochia fimbriata]|uniref:Uncharacterized protein n=1 Tax=Aristolochia fimbriata TaxID=158543 RepID=A0AAV7F6E0_ARIFI|nr:hypothetical protein H6P81_001061 [Aristolochia fimbriata]